MKKFVSIILMLAMLASFAACQTTPTTPADSTDGGAPADDTTPAETTAPEEPDLPEISLDGEEITLWIDWAGNNFYADIEIDEDNAGDVVAEAVNERNAWVADTYDVKLDWDIPSESKWRDMAMFRQSVQAGDEYDVAQSVTLYITPLLLSGCFTNLYDTDIDFDQDWWFRYVNDSMYVGDRLYLASGYFDYPTVLRSALMFFSSTMAEDYELGNLYDLVENNQWTADKMQELAEIVADDLNQDGIYDETDQYGVTGGWDMWGGYACASGHQYITRKDDGSLELTGVTDHLLEIHEAIYPMITDAKYYWSQYTYGGERNSHGMTMFLEDRCLFMIGNVSVTAVKSLRDLGTFGLLPLPKVNAEQERYGAYTTPFVSAIPVTAGDTDSAALILQAMNKASLEILYPAHYETAVSYKYVNDPQSAKIAHMVFQNVACDFSYHYAMAGLDTTLFNAISINENLASYLQINEGRLQQGLDNLTKQIELLPQ